MSVMVDHTGETFGRLTVIRRVPEEPKHHGKTAWECRCACGGTTIVVAPSLLNGLTKSCGCLKKEVTGDRWRTHGRTKTREYKSWSGAKTRCFNPKNPAWNHYGGRGITMCGEWRESFEAFLRDMGPCPPGYSIDRVNNDGDYESGNCRWAPDSQQANNKRANHFIEHAGRRMTISEWDRELGFPKGTLKQRLSRGWPIDRALTEPLREDQLYIWNDQALTLMDWSRRLGIQHQTLRKRLELGWPLEKALATPARQ
jgi:hypothetical protein